LATPTVDDRTLLPYTLASDHAYLSLARWRSSSSSSCHFSSVPCTAALANRRSPPPLRVLVPRHPSIKTPSAHPSLSHFHSSTPSPSLWNTSEAMLHLLSIRGRRVKLVGLQAAGHRGCLPSPPYLLYLLAHAPSII
jgi:hypothetical protein